MKRREKKLSVMDWVLVGLLDTLVGVVAGGLMAIWQLPSAYRWRGYWAIGGEWLLVIIAIIMAVRLTHAFQMFMIFGGKKHGKMRSVSQGHYRLRAPLSAKSSANSRYMTYSPHTKKALTRTASALQMDRDPHIPLALDAGTSSRKIQVSTTHNHIVAYSVEFFNRYEAARKDYPFCRFSMQKLGGTTWKKNLLPP